MYVLSGISVILQVLYYKLTKKRIFLMAPFHHHLEMKGLHESKIVTIYFVCSMVGGRADADICEGDMNFVGRKVVVYGAGASGICAYELLREKGARAIVYDDDPSRDRATNSGRRV